MNRKSVLETVYSLANDAIIIFSTGYVSREAFTIEDRDSNFYMLGSMGLAASIGIGMAINMIKKPIIVIEGDGSFLMNPSNIFLAKNLHLNNFLHIILDNNSYESTGGQKTCSNILDFATIASASGYTSVRIENLCDLEENLNNFLKFRNGPIFYDIKIELSKEKIAPRVNIPLVQLNNRLSKYCSNSRGIVNIFSHI